MIDIAKVMNDAEISDKVYTMYVYPKKQVHITLEAFLEVFDTYQIEHRDCKDYPWQAVAVYDGVEFFALMTNKQRKELLK